MAGEGLVGVSAMLDGGRTTSCTMVQAETATCYRMTVEALRRETDRHGALYDLLMPVRTALMGFVMQSTACNAVHSVEQGLARWLLMAHDVPVEHGRYLARAIPNCHATIYADDAHLSVPLNHQKAILGALATASSA